MFQVNITVDNDQTVFVVGDHVRGKVNCNLPLYIEPGQVQVSLRCLGEVKWVEHVTSPYYLNGNEYHDRHYYLKELLPFKESDVNSVKCADYQNITIPFNFHIPKNKNLPSTMGSVHGFIKYFIAVKVIVSDDPNETKKFSKDIIVQSPMRQNLMVTIGGSADRSLEFYGGNIVMHASIDRKGFTRGEMIPVHVSVENGSSIAVAPQVSLHQVQIFMSGFRHKTVHTMISQEPVTGTPVQSNSVANELISVQIPENEALSIKSSLITVKYFVHVTLPVPQTIGVHVELPVVLTIQNDIDI